MRQAIFHPWLIREGASMTSVPVLEWGLLQSLQGYAATPPLHRAILQLLAQELEPQEVRELHEVFLALDLENKGSVHARDLKHAVHVTLARPAHHVTHGVRPPEDLDVEAICSAIDVLPGERISFSDFLAASMKARACCRESSARAVFRRLGANDSQSLSADGLRSVFGKAFGLSEVEDWFRQAAPDCSMMTFDDFQHALQRPMWDGWGSGVRADGTNAARKVAEEPVCCGGGTSSPTTVGSPKCETESRMACPAVWCPPRSRPIVQALPSLSLA
mmetsp:Transcript_118526/g.368368  ORF Transcript_118526/g.368368 Transcript_118526/m.368368 type:complete len:275 (+) Transcript_118526:42-866(+)